MEASHEPDGYHCPLCALLVGVENEWNRASDLVAVEPLAFARISPKAWVDQPGNALVCNTDHVENLYGLSVAQNAALFGLVQRVAVAMHSSYGCDGISIRQHNEPAGDQDLWHVHVHVFPRYAGDELYRRHDDTAWIDAAVRAGWAERLRAGLTPPS
ncbi:HIT domain-containing protein [Nakamurella sp. A5-74]|uniref:HIT domain-containing protein n=1 Tax=Nakamurella sp. A5-74 TaxID=3158264 RepID=A0AAU8DQ64_9ACTN